MQWGCGNAVRFLAGEVTACVMVTVALIAMQLHDVKRMLLNMDGVRDGSRANATGPIARLILNWFQATGLLSTIKLVRS